MNNEPTKRNEGAYDDLLDLPHYEPKHHHRMTMMARAAQFAPFSALSGLDKALQQSLLEHLLRQNDTQDK